MSRPVIRAPLKLQLSREMKVLLLLLLLVALIGGGYLGLSARHAAALARTPGAAGGSPTPPDASGLPVQPGGQVDVPSIPAFGADPTAGASDPGAPAAPPPGGINPDTPLATLPSRNPFRPVELDADATPAGEAASPASAPSVPASPVTVAESPITFPSSSPVSAPTPAGTSGNDLFTDAGDDVPAVTPLPRAAAPVEVASAPVSGGRLPTVSPTAGPTAGGVVTLTPAAPRTLPVPQTPTPVTVTPAPVRPPVAGVRVPGGPINLNGLLGQRGPASGAATAPGSPRAAGTGAAPTALPTPELPQPITQLGADGAAGAAPLSVLEDLVRRRELAFDTGVLGPVNTAILRSKGGFLVVSTGQTLPDSDVVVREVTATQLTLTLGNDSTTLTLDDPTKGEP